MEIIHETADEMHPGVKPADSPSHNAPLLYPTITAKLGEDAAIRRMQEIA